MFIGIERERECFRYRAFVLVQMVCLRQIQIRERGKVTKKMSTNIDKSRKIFMDKGDKEGRSKITQRN